MTKPVVCLVDCNNFYVSCERVFNGAIQNKPVIVVGNGDHCIVARSNEAKALGLAMGMPVFECQAIIERYGVLVYSSNYALYHDLSHRVMAVLSAFSPRLEVCSIDEAWLDLSHIGSDE